MTPGHGWVQRPEGESVWYQDEAGPRSWKISGYAALCYAVLLATQEADILFLFGVSRNASQTLVVQNRIELTKQVFRLLTRLSTSSTKYVGSEHQELSCRDHFQHGSTLGDER